MDKNKYVMVLLYLIVVIFILLQIQELYGNKIEMFQYSHDKVKNNNINCIILSPLDNRTPEEKSDNIDNIYNKYYGTYINSKNDSDVEKSLNLYNVTDFFSGNKWRKVVDNKLDSDNNVVIVDLLYDKNKRMMAIGLYYTKIDDKLEPVYNIYRKTNSYMNSVWEKIGDDVKKRSLCYDINTGKLLGVSSEDGQIYEQVNNNDFEKWDGPINYDIPMKKIMYNNHEIMIGIGLFDNFIYTKKRLNWKSSYWDKKEINRTKVYDLIYHHDGCFIATSPEGILKQTSPGLAMPFVNITSKNFNRHNNNEDVLSKSNILKYKIGYDIIEEDDIFNCDRCDDKLKKSLKNIYKLKQRSLDLCRNRKYFKNKDKKLNDEDSLNLKYREINDLYKNIEEINDKMTK